MDKKGPKEGPKEGPELIKPRKPRKSEKVRKNDLFHNNTFIHS
jgi:hypothetical protein